MIGLGRILIVAAAVACTSALAADPAPAPASAPAGASLRLSPATPALHLGSRFRLIASGDTAAKLRETEPANLTVLIDDQPIPGLQLRYLQGAAPDDLELSASLVRDSESETSRKAWDVVLGGHRSATMEVTLALQIGKDPAIRLQQATVNFSVAPGWRIWGAALGGVLLFYLAFRTMVRHESVLRDARGGPYSLGKTQMAFWGLIVLLSFAGVWLLTGQLERIPPGVLVLMGISAGTGLGAVMIRQGKVDDRTAQLDKNEAEFKDQRAKAATDADKADIDAKLDKIAQAREALQAAASGQVASRGFWYDLCDGGGGPGVHRVQMVLWTIVMGLVFVRSVVNLMTMPEFSDTLLLLMGISSGTYLGFKFPEPPPGEKASS